MYVAQYTNVIHIRLHDMYTVVMMCRYVQVCVCVCVDIYDFANDTCTCIYTIYINVYIYMHVYIYQVHKIHDWLWENVYTARRPM